MIHAPNTGKEAILYLAIIGIILLACAALPASAYLVINGNITMAPTPVPTIAPEKNFTDPKHDYINQSYTIIRGKEKTKLNDTYVHQGDTICSGYTYDLSGVWGFTGGFGWWESWWKEDGQYPDKTNIVSGQPHLLRQVTLDETNWPIGNWYQMDYHRAGDTDYSDPNWTIDQRKGNDFAFKIIYCPYSFSGGIPGTESKGYSGEGNTVSAKSAATTKPSNVTGDISHAVSQSNLSATNITYSKNATMYIQSGNTTIEVPVTVEATGPAIVDTLASQANEKSIQVQSTTTENITVPATTIPLPTETLEYVMPKTPVNPLIPIFGILAGAIILCRRR